MFSGLLCCVVQSEDLQDRSRLPEGLSRLPRGRSAGRVGSRAVHCSCSAVSAAPDVGRRGERSPESRQTGEVLGGRATLVLQQRTFDVRFDGRPQRRRRCRSRRRRRLAERLRLRPGGRRVVRVPATGSVSVCAFAFGSVEGFSG